MCAQQQKREKRKQAVDWTGRTLSLSGLGERMGQLSVNHAACRANVSAEKTTLRDLVDRLGVRRHQEMIALAGELDRPRIGSRAARHRHS